MIIQLEGGGGRPGIGALLAAKGILPCLVILLSLPAMAELEDHDLGRSARSSFFISSLNSSACLSDLTLEAPL